MINVIVKNSICQITRISPTIEAELKELLTYTDSAKEYSYLKNQKAIRAINAILDRVEPGSPTEIDLQKKMNKLLFMNRKLNAERKVCLYKNARIATGLLPRVEAYLTTHKIDYELTDQRTKPTLNSARLILKESFPPLRHYQKTAYKALMEHSRGIIVSATGTGKSLIIMKMLWELGVPALVITPSKNITAMIYDSLVQHFGKGKVAKLNTKSKKISTINVCNIQALVKIDPKILQTLGAVFIDEFHHAGADQYLKINERHLASCYYRIGLSATPWRPNGSSMAMESILSGILMEYSTKQAIAEGYLVQPEFRIIDNTVHSPSSNYQKHYREGIVEYKARNKLIADIAEDHADDSVIILVQQIEHGEALLKLMPHATFVNGLNKDTKKVLENFKSGKIKLLIGTSVIGEGVDLPRANVLIMAGAGKSEIGVIQAVGRVLRTFKDKNGAIVYDFADQGAKYLEKHGLIRDDIYNTYY